MVMVSLSGTLRRSLVSGRFDYLPCGPGTAAHLAPLGDAGRLSSGQVISHESIVGTRPTGRSPLALGGEPPGRITGELEGIAFRTGQDASTIDEADPVGTEIRLT